MNNHPDTIGSLQSIVSLNQPHRLTALQARQLLVDGNIRFQNNQAGPKDVSRERRKTLSVEGQKPFAAITGCADSRVPPELVFDAGLGELFVVRSAGNLLDSIAIGSIEFAVTELNVPLVLILGHQGCGAVEAAVRAVETNTSLPSYLGSIIEKIRPVVDRTRAEGKTGLALINSVVEQNVRTAVDELLSRSRVVADAVHEGRLAVFGAKYALETGIIRFLE